MAPLPSQRCHAKVEPVAEGAYVPPTAPSAVPTLAVPVSDAGVEVVNAPSATVAYAAEVAWSPL